MSYFENSAKWNPTKQRMLIKDFQLNMEEFKLMMTQKIDFNAIDVLSITRADVQPSIKQQLKHARAAAKSTRFSLPTAKIIPLPTK